MCMRRVFLKQTQHQLIVLIGQNSYRLSVNSLALKYVFFIRVAYFNHAANLLQYFDKLLKKVTLNRLTNCINRSKFLSVIG